MIFDLCPPQEEVMKAFGGIQPTELFERFRYECDPEQIVSVHFFAEIPPVRTLAGDDQRRRFNMIVDCHAVRNAFGDLRSPFNRKVDPKYSTKFEVIGSLANLLDFGGLHSAFAQNTDDALQSSRAFLDKLLPGNYSDAEAYTLHEGWNDWFLSDDYLDETILVGRRLEWWLLALTASDGG